MNQSVNCKCPAVALWLLIAHIVAIGVLVLFWGQTSVYEPSAIPQYFKIGDEFSTHGRLHHKKPSSRDFCDYYTDGWFGLGQYFYRQQVTGFYYQGGKLKKVLVITAVRGDESGYEVPLEQ